MNRNAKTFWAALGITTTILCISLAPAEARGADDPMVVANAILKAETDAWNGSGRTDPAEFTADVDLINSQGPLWHGREVVRENTQQVFDTHRPKLTFEIVSAERIAPNVILVLSRGTANMPEGGPGPKSVSMHQMRILVKSKGKWLVRALSSTPITR